MGVLGTLASLSRPSLVTNSRMAHRVISNTPIRFGQPLAERTASVHFTTLCRTCCLLPSCGVGFHHGSGQLRRLSVRVGKSRLPVLGPAMAVVGKTVSSWVGKTGSSWVGKVGVVRMMSSGGPGSDTYHKRTGLIYVCAAGIFMLGMAYAGVPLYRMFCQATGLGGTISRGHDTSKIETMQPVPERIINIRFNADVASSMRWNFKPQQTEVKVLPGETALAFYTAKNPTDKPVIGISTYNVVPFDAGQYFNKIQCFCFEEQRLNPHEQ